jgi:hypothetical protein
LRRVSVEAMMMTRLRFFASSCGNAEMPSRSGISMSSTATSGLTRSTWLTASSPVRSDAATTMSGSASIQRLINPRITTESSTTMTRSGSCRAESRVEELASATLITHQRNIKQHYKDSRNNANAAENAAASA